MTRVAIAYSLMLAAAQTALADPLHFVNPVGDTPTPDPNVVVSTWDFGLRMQDPDFWVSTAFDASIHPAPAGVYAFTNIRDQLEPPTNPVEDTDMVSTFFSTAQQYPNNLTYAETPTYVFDFSHADASSLSVMWQSGSPADGIGPDIVLFRMAILRPAGSPALSTTPFGSPVVTMSGISYTNDFGGIEFNLGLYQVPEPTVALLLLVGLGAMSGRRRIG